MQDTPPGAPASAPSAASSASPPPAARRSRRSPLPGFGLAMGTTLLLLTLVVLLPLSALAFASTELGFAGFLEVVATDRALAAYKLTFVASFTAAAINLVCGTVCAWVLIRYRFPGRRLLDALIDLPFAIPTAISGIALTAIYSPKSWLGSHLAALGLDVAFTPLGVTLALVFVTLPFVIRTVQPVLEELDSDLEEQAALLGASRFTIIRRVIAPQLVPAALTGFALAFARAIGEYGSVVFISGNMPGKTEIAPLLIMTRLEQFDYPGATAIAVALLTVSFLMLLVVNRLQAWSRARTGQLT